MAARVVEPAASPGNPREPQAPQPRQDVSSSSVRQLEVDGNTQVAQRLAQMRRHGKAARLARGQRDDQAYFATFGLQLAKEIGISYATLSRVENGEEPSGKTLAAILRWMLEKTKNG